MQRSRVSNQMLFHRMKILPLELKTIHLRSQYQHRVQLITSRQFWLCRVPLICSPIVGNVLLGSCSRVCHELAANHRDTSPIAFAADLREKINFVAQGGLRSFVSSTMSRSSSARTTCSSRTSSFPTRCNLSLVVFYFYYSTFITLFVLFFSRVYSFILLSLRVFFSRC